MATYTVSETGAGADYSAAQLNADAMSLTAGDTIEFIGTITSEIICPASGSADNPITFRGTTGVLAHQSGNPDLTWGISIQARDYIHITEITTQTDGNGIANLNFIRYINPISAGISVIIPAPTSRFRYRRNRWNP